MALLQLKHELTREQEGPKYDVFVRVLRGLSNSKLAKPGKFRTADGMGYALRCSYKVGVSPSRRLLIAVLSPASLRTLGHDTEQQ